MRKTAWTDPYRLAPALPAPEDLEPLRDLALDVLLNSRELEATLAPETGNAIGERVRLFNSLYSNHIEGQTSTYRHIEEGLNRQFSPIQEQRYAQELGTAHVKVEQEVVQAVMDDPKLNVSDPAFIADIHKRFFSYLPEEHQFTHEGEHFTSIPVQPGEFRDHSIGIRGNFGTMPIGPRTKPELLANMEAFGNIFNPANFHGEAKIIAAAASHLKLAWLHPFRDGNGRTVRLYSTCFMAQCGINRANLWSLSRGMAVHRAEYMNGLFIGDPQPIGSDRDKVAFVSENVAMFCDDFLNICIEQIAFMRQQLKLQTIADRIDRFAFNDLNHYGKHKMDAGRLLRSVFAHGRLERKEAYAVLGGINQRSAQRIINGLIGEGLLNAKDHKAPLSIGLPARAMQAYFPSLCAPGIMGEELP